MNMPDIPESITLPAAMSVLSTPKGLCFPPLSTLLNLLLGTEKTLILFCPVSLQWKHLLTHSLISPSQWSLATQTDLSFVDPET